MIASLLRYASINMAMMAMLKSIDLLGRERPIVARERARGAYGATEYVQAQAVVAVGLRPESG